MGLTVEDLKSWFGISDEQIAEKQAAAKAQIRQSLTDKRAAAIQNVADIDAELAALEEPVVDPTPEEPQA